MKSKTLASLKTPLVDKILEFTLRLPKKAKPRQITNWNLALFFLFFYNLYLLIFLGSLVFQSHLQYLAYVALVYDIFYCKFRLEPIPSLWNKVAFLTGFLGGCASFFFMEPLSILYGALTLSVVFGNLYAEKPQPLRLMSALTYGFVGVNLALILPSLPIMLMFNCIIFVVVKFQVSYLYFPIFPEKGKYSRKKDQ